MPELQAEAPPRLAESLTELIGHTPMMRVPGPQDCGGEIYAKLEMFNPLSSVKDRVGYYMVNGAEARGDLKPGGTVIEATSGNTGIALAAICAARGYRCVIVMPDSASVERIRILQSFGAEVHLSPYQKGYVAAIEAAEVLHNQTPGSWFVRQHENPDNVAAHFETTGPEIWATLGERIDALVCGIGTGGTISGIGRYLKQRNPRIRVIGVEPARSPVISEGWGGIHRIPGLNGGFIAATTDLSIIDETITVSDEDAEQAAARVAGSTGLFIGISAGAAYHGAVEYLTRHSATGPTVATLFPDSGERYLSWKNDEPLPKTPSES
jgi:cysteine synthase